MLLWLKSKFAMIVAGIILISAVTTFFYFQMGQVDSQRMQSYSDHIANTVQNMYTSDSDTASQRITFDEEGGIDLPKDIGGDTYDLVFTRNNVAVEIDGHRRGSEFGLDVHLWNPAQLGRIDRLSDEEAEEMDEEHDSILRISSTDDKVVNIQMLRMDNGTTEVNRVFVFESEA